MKDIYLFTKYLFWAGDYATYWVTASTGTNDSCPQELTIYLGYNQIDSSLIEYQVLDFSQLKLLNFVEFQ